MSNNNVDLYEIFSTYTYDELLELMTSSKNDDERLFYMTLCNMLLSREQKKVLGNSK